MLSDKGRQKRVRQGSGKGQTRVRQGSGKGQARVRQGSDFEFGERSDST
jgi:hypothetical protein